MAGYPRTPPCCAGPAMLTYREVLLYPQYMDRFPDGTPDEDPFIKGLMPLGIRYDFNVIGRFPQDKSSRLLGHHCHGLPYQPNPDVFIGIGDLDLVGALQPETLRLLFLRDLGDLVESSAQLIGEKIMERGSREKALGLQMPFFAVQDGEELGATPATTIGLLQQIRRLFATDEETNRIRGCLLTSYLASVDHSGGMVLEIPGVYCMTNQLSN